MRVKAVVYSRDAAKDLRRHGNVASRIRAVIAAYAADGQAHANNVTQLVGLTARRLRVGNYRVIFEEEPDRILVTKVGPRGGVYE